MTGRAQHHARGFTMIEVTLASLIGGMVLLGAVGVFRAMSTAERVFGQRYERQTELAVTQAAMRRAMLMLVIAQTENNRSSDAETAEDERRPRLILGPDMAAPGVLANGSVPQRLEVVLSAAPVPDALSGAGPMWARVSEGDPTLDMDVEFEADDGAIRGVFELRPDGSRERLMRGLGVANVLWPLDPPDADEMSGWTLWWRPIPPQELAALEAGYPWESDVAGEPAWQRYRLAGAVPLARGLDAMRWYAFRNRERSVELAVVESEDLPAYLEMELLASSGAYANWMFEVFWTIGADAETDDDGPDPNQNDDQSDDIQGGFGGPGGGPGDRRALEGGGDQRRRLGERAPGGRQGDGRGDRPPRGGDPDRVNVINLGGGGG